MIYQLSLNLLSSLNNKIVNLGIAIVTLLLGFIMGKLIERIIFKMLNEFEINKALKNSTGMKVNLDHLISTILAYVIYFFALVAALEQIGLTNTVLYLLSGTIILIILISFFLAIRDFIPNLMAGFYLYSKDDIKEGKHIEIGDIKGEILKIDLVQIKVQSKNGDILHIPNSTVVKSNIKVRKRKI